MKQELESILVKNFPKLFRDYHGDMTQTCMTWGCDVGDGWFPILYQLCKDLSEMARKEGQEREETLYFTQIKEKFGVLTVYVAGATDEMHELINKAEVDSSLICEMCGNAGKLGGKGWISTLCDICRKKK